MRARPPRCSSTCPARFARPPTSSKPSECSSAGISRTRAEGSRRSGFSAWQSGHQRRKPGEGAWRGGTMAWVLLAAMYARLGCTDKALAVVSEALGSIETSEERWLESELHRLRGELLQSRDAAEADRSITAALEIARRQSSTSLELRAALSLHAITSGAKKKRAREDVARALSRITGGSDAPDVVEARRVVGGRGRYLTGPS